MVSPLAFEFFSGPELAWVIVGALALAFILASACDALVSYSRHLRGWRSYGINPQARASRRVNRDRSSCVPTNYEGALVVAILSFCSLVMGYAIGRAALALLGVS